MLLRVPKDCKFKRVWHFLKIFPKEKFEYCTNVALEKAYGDNLIEKFNAIAYFGALFALRRLRLSVQAAFQTEIPYENQTGPNRAFGKIPRRVWKQWSSCVRGFLPEDRELFKNSLVGARDREFGVCRLITFMLKATGKLGNHLWKCQLTKIFAITQGVDQA